jgi:hypothetical protein
MMATQQALTSRDVVMVILLTDELRGRYQEIVVSPLDAGRLHRGLECNVWRLCPITSHLDGAKIRNPLEVSVCISL